MGATGLAGDARTDLGWLGAAGLHEAAAIAVAAANTKAAIDIADKQERIADGYLKMQQTLHNYWLGSFKPCEESALAEACNEPEHPPDYETQAGRFEATAKLQFANAKLQLERSVSKYCSGMLDGGMRVLTLAEAQATTDAINYSYRYAEARADAKNDVRWARKYQMIALGRNLLSSGLSFSQAASNIYSSLGSQAAQGASSAFWALGYSRERNPTAAPQFRTANPQVPQMQSAPQPGGFLYTPGNSARIGESAFNNPVFQPGVDLGGVQGRTGFGFPAVDDPGTGG